VLLHYSRGSHEAFIAPVLMRRGRRANPIYNSTAQSILKAGKRSSQQLLVVVAVGLDLAARLSGIIEGELLMVERSEQHRSPNLPDEG